ncbi:MAG: hypothetical protein AB9879_10385 [Methanothrix sp.]
MYQDPSPNHYAKNHIAFWDAVRRRWPEKFRDQERFVFQSIRPGDRIFIGTGCGEPQHLVASLLDYVKTNPKAFLDGELINIVTLGVAPYTDEKFKDNFRLNSLFHRRLYPQCRQPGAADYTPVFLSDLPDLIRSREDTARCGADSDNGSRQGRQYEPRHQCRHRHDGCGEGANL